MSNAPKISVTREGTHVPARQYSRVLIGQGKHVFDVDLNDIGALAEEQITRFRQTQTRSEAHRFQGSFGFVPLSVGESGDRSTWNFGISRGVVSTRFGNVDTLADFDEDFMFPYVVFNYFAMVQDGFEVAQDEAFANYILKGTVTSSGSTTSFVDANKEFTESHRLTATEIIVARSVPTAPVDLSPEGQEDPALGNFVLREPACLVVMLTGPNAGLAREVTAVSTSNTLTTTAFPSPVGLGDEYVIVPGSPLNNDAYAAASAGDSWEKGDPDLAWVAYLDVWEEDVSPEEDTDLKHPAYTGAGNVSHRTQVRWAVRVFSLTMPASSVLSEGPLVADTLGRTSAWNPNDAAQQDRDVEGRRGVAFGPLGGPSFAARSPYEGIPASAVLNAGVRSARLPLSFSQALFACVESIMRAGYSDHAVHGLWFLGLPEKVAGTALTGRMYPNGPYAPPSADMPVMRLWTESDTPENYKGQCTFFHSVPQILGNDRMSEELVRASSLNPATGSSGAAGFVRDDSTEAAVSWPSFSAKQSFVDAAIVWLLGVGQGDLRYDLTAVRKDNGGPPTSKTVIGSDDSAMTAAGERAASVVGTGHMINADVRLQGTVYMVDPLPTSSVDTKNGTVFVQGVGEYHLRNDVSVETGDEEGWSFMVDVDSASTVEGGPRPRTLDNGIAQAAALRDGLNWRLLAVKSAFDAQGELFTINMPMVSINEAMTTEYATVAGLGAVSGAALRISNSEMSEDYSSDRANWSTYEGTIPIFPIVDPLPFSNPMRGRQPDSPLRSNGGESGITEELYFQKKHPDGAPIAIRSATSYVAAQSSNYDAGANPRADIPLPIESAWGRGEFDFYEPGMRDYVNGSTFEDRCTTLRLRYHVGDYYPAPDGSNALVQTLNLFVRIEPLSLVHWMTMPAHQHPILSSSMQLWETLRAASDTLAGEGDASKLTNGSGSPLIRTESPARIPNSLSVGDVDPWDQPFDYWHQMYVHWDHPNMEQVTAPAPSGNWTSPVVTGAPVYRRFGSLSLISPAVVSTESPTEANAPGGVRDPSDSITAGRVTDVDAVELLGNHRSKVTVAGVEEYLFPFVPEDYNRAGTTPTTIPGQGYPTSVFFPAFRGFAWSTAYGAEGPVGQIGYASAINSEPTDPDEAIGFPAFDGPTAQERVFGPGGYAPKFGVPYLRAAIRTRTLAEIVKATRVLMRPDVTTADEQPFSNSRMPLSGPDYNTDTTFVGSLGTGLFQGHLTGTTPRAPMAFAHPSMLGLRVSPDGIEHVSSGNTDDIRDAFAGAALERLYLAGVDSVVFNPLVNTLHAIAYMGLQQKLMWNSSFRILHVRPGGGNTGASLATSSAPKSLTELFLCRNRLTNTPVPLPAPDRASAKPYIHLESMHPAAAGGLTIGGTVTQEHPNHAFTGHLYRMVSDSLGGYVGTPDAGVGPIHPSAWDTPEFKTALNGDTYAADPFDSMFAAAKAVADGAAPAAVNLRETDRLQENSGIEFDLLHELRFVRENAADHGLDSPGTNGLTWLDTMPTPEELSAPGDHEILFVLYTGRNGQKMADPDVPDGFNPPVAGCKVTARIEINRPSERLSSELGEGGMRYGRGINTYRILG